MSELTLVKAVELCRAKNVSSAQIKEVQQKENIGGIKKKINGNYEEKNKKTERNNNWFMVNAATSARNMASIKI